MSAFSTLFERRPDPYAGADLATAKRLGGILWLVGAALALALLPASPPDEAIGDAGWALAGALIVVAAGLGLFMLRLPQRFGANTLMAMSYAALAQIATLEWLAGPDSPYHELFLISILYTACAHPPRRVAPYLAAAAVLAAAPLVYDEWSASLAGETGLELLLWLGMALAGLVVMANVRAQRVGLRREGAHERHLARQDPLTGLGNRRAFDESLSAEVAHARWSGRPLSVAVADLNGFKEINDRFGHLEGDRCLCDVAAVLERTLRRPDASYRWGGDEFVLLLPGTDYEGAVHLGERLGEAVAATCRRPDGDRLEMTCGTAQLEPGMSPAELLAAADLALLAAKGPGAPGRLVAPDDAAADRA